MSGPQTADMAAHDLNNLLGKILGSAELALDHTRVASVRAELYIIMLLAEDGGKLVQALAERSRQTWTVPRMPRSIDPDLAVPPRPGRP